ncbi:MAG TPA: hypothetical protein VFL80_06840, partial [Thermoanaerobaculia bacterium]|nr:hypothetical protein [Thermoanaerobaculia bacterium]
RGRDGDLVAQFRIDEGPDALPTAIDVVRNTPWVSISRGCLSGLCERKTIVLDPLSLTPTATMTGGVVDVAVSGTRAYVITELPSEIRVVNVSDPLHPVVSTARATEGTPAPVAIASPGGDVLVLGEKLYSYSELGLNKTADRLASYVPAAEGGTSYADQRIATLGACAVITSRAFNPQFYALPQFGLAREAPVPSVVRSVAVSGDRLYVLTDHSIEVWSPAPLAQPPRHRPTR